MRGFDVSICTSSSQIITNYWNEMLVAERDMKAPETI